MPQELTVKSVEKLARDWFKKLDVHAPMVEILPLLSSDEEFRIVFIDGVTLRNFADFEMFYHHIHALLVEALYFLQLYILL